MAVRNFLNNISKDSSGEPREIIWNDLCLVEILLLETIHSTVYIVYHSCQNNHLYNRPNF